MKSSPLQRFPLSNTAARSMMVEVKKESENQESDGLPAPFSSSINLGLEIGINSARNRNSSTASRQGESVLTLSQLHELEQQIIVHKHLAAGSSVPTHLLISIWKSVARTLGSNASGIFERYRSFIGFNPLGFDHKSMMDPEPERCRRTDGKKWRCSRKTVASQKYCEQHMHRGRSRSRKPVEINTPSYTNLLNNPYRDLKYTVASPVTATCRNDNTKIQFNCDYPSAVTFSPITESVIPSLKTVIETITSSPHSPTAIRSYDGTKTIKTVPANATNPTAKRVKLVPRLNPTANVRIDSSCVIDLKDVYSINSGENCSGICNAFRKTNTNIQKIPSPGLGLSPNSVLQVSGCSKINTELEPGRCRRTDGKRWRCRREVISNQKYCGRHMHRGSKRHLKAAENQNGVVSATSTARSGTTPMPSSLNTSLSMAIRAGDEERSNISSETTVIDTVINAYENISS